MARARLRRELLVDQRGIATTSHSRPFDPWIESTCTAPGLGLVLAGREPVALLGLGEPAEERAERRVLASVDETGEQFVERLEARRRRAAGRHSRRPRCRAGAPAARGARSRRGRGPAAPAQRLQLGAGAAHAGRGPVSLKPRERRVPVGCGEQEVERVDDRGRLVGRDRRPEPRRTSSSSRLAARSRSASHRASSSERREVGRADAPARAAEHAQELGARGRVVQHAQHAHEVGDRRAGRAGRPMPSTCTARRARAARR